MHILERLTHELPATLTYHAADHTKDVLEEVTRFATEDKLPEREIHLLQVAAAFHDSGFLIGPLNHENVSSSLASAAMKRFGGYSSEEIITVCQMIEDTKLIRQEQRLMQVPHRALSRYLLDADMSNLGRDDFFEKTALVRRESPIASEEQFSSNLINIISSKIWYTPAAKRVREENRRRNLEKLMAISG